MKKILVFFVLLFAVQIQAQFENDLYSDEGVLSGGLGMSWIDGQANYTFRFRPEVAFGNFGAGLDLNLEFNSDGIRTENFNTASDYLAIIRYLRWGHKNDPLYIRVGALDNSTLGYGNIMYLYNNSPSFDARTIGLEVGLDMDLWGVEAVYGNFADAGILGARGYVRPLKFTSAGDIPIIGNIEVGATFTTDVDKKAGYLGGYYDVVKDDFIATRDTGSIKIISADIGLPIFQTSVTSLELYITHTQILDFGSGQAYGALFNFDFTGVSLKVKLERNINGKQYIPAYFDALYEIDRFRMDENGDLSGKAKELEIAALDAVNGWNGGLFLDVMNLFRVSGSYQRLDGDNQNGTLYLGAEVNPMGTPMVVRAGYDKTGITTESEMFTLDDRSRLFVEAGYKPYPFMIVSLVYLWTFEPIRGVDETILGYEPQKRIEPRVTFVMPLNF
ncbi:MAG: hypothetical protein KKF62_12900 [Bacteroidetes bacterium]|nr:hypothetical protein [Bacteroidota bacterium]MBU1114778.1 hypothetical protein [Bacteroidota bacterium]MBU1799069.1 hypothetical protein [Bacteroidota bacterium]